MQKIITGSDHGGFELKAKLKETLLIQGMEIVDLGCDDTASCDYPDYGIKVAREVAGDETLRGLLICKSGIGMSMAANRVPGARAALCHNKEIAALSRQHNNANILVMGSSFVSLDEAAEILATFLETEYEGGRHERRVNKIEEGARS